MDLPLSIKIKILGCKNQFDPNKNLNPAIQGNINLKVDGNDLEFCIEWMKRILKNELTSYGPNNYKVDVGPFVGIWPCEINKNKVSLSVDYFDETKEDWRDWFVIGDEDASFIAA